MRPKADRRRIALAGVALTAVSFVVFAIVGGGFLDLHVYRVGGYAWLHGIGLYSDEFPRLVPVQPLPFTYPPLAAILFAPVSALPWQVAKFAITLVSAAALVTTTALVARRLYGTGRAAAIAGFGAAAVSLLFEPVRKTVEFGQVNLLLMGLVALDCLSPRTRWPRGLLIGLAAAIKLTPAVFVLFFLVRRQYRPAAVSVASFAGFGLAGYALAPSDTAGYWFGVLLHPERIGGTTYPFNQCYQAILHRLLPDGTVLSALWFALVVLTIGLAVLAAARARAAGDDVTALLAVALGGLLASPVSWSHHWVWVVPAGIAMVHRFGSTWRGRALIAAVLAVYAVGAHAFLPDRGAELDWSWWQHLLGSSYVLVGFGALVVLALRRDRVPAEPVAHGGERSVDLA
ncbi:glycosyltransferase 87 family protein [Amycolatopsis sp. CA-230715]|uniref:glycosyltransferase 87 family protein n=1 Tax=Amycolatopsis sp. CA-230715 TaxID=2745196 RepID=UPI001C010BE5|nr:glycosyltransferase 87 family protein [Amycolatopsis sp. CA-230715]QWF83620.1 Polyprenol-phosphate-mannose-dependent alpha-(1-2)-phosphatidylinositol mannoside mannosyltransferase [Amycolatopsis sp. CA-230715]